MLTREARSGTTSRQRPAGRGQDAGPQDLGPLAPDPFPGPVVPPGPARPESRDGDDGEESPLSPWRFH